ncbi:hypothetical protein DUNSADRAFT_14482 [Dunaliella salina]|uniref:mRNA capping enzyme adenylation domain-containing protein n=1 Tax=Dunaliella salina TaxID=3046 RepID=A0ABQ7H2K0_DUNSA|nr:hypothetical protein DUNSADRAFT_14482 [Dunaliella salina]|eukprot:KAF5841083.1 hypothetical protein DUNSADRAFT_14482 [Dunaliella salina]
MQTHVSTSLQLLRCANKHRTIPFCRYWVSWKADGTRYLLLILNQGCYLINREFKVVRLQMRFPTPQKPSKAKVYPVSVKLATMRKMIGGSVSDNFNLSVCRLQLLSVLAHPLGLGCGVQLYACIRIGSSAICKFQRMPNYGLNLSVTTDTL